MMNSTDDPLPPPSGNIDQENEASRFRVNRINSTQLSQSSPPTSGGFGETIPEDSTLEINSSGVPNSAIPNQFMQPRRSSIAQGLGGGRKKSVQLPKDFDYTGEYESSIANNKDHENTVYGKTFAYYTREALPKLDHYKNMASVGNVTRPTLDELRSEAMYAKVKMIKLNAFYGLFECLIRFYLGKKVEDS